MWRWSWRWATRDPQRHWCTPPRLRLRRSEGRSGGLPQVDSVPSPFQPITIDERGSRSPTEPLIEAPGTRVTEPSVQPGRSDILVPNPVKEGGDQRGADLFTAGCGHHGDVIQDGPGRRGHDNRCSAARSSRKTADTGHVPAASGSHEPPRQRRAERQRDHAPRRQLETVATNDSVEVCGAVECAHQESHRRAIQLCDERDRQMPGRVGLQIGAQEPWSKRREQPMRETLTMQACGEAEVAA